ncbi:MAG: SlyX protein [Dinoroseobacter sp.]|jgi:SlyX protein|uniref:SlyX family protein n=1 Tax=Alterinioella nitratireducens TaxID=2735915 RepID=UPI000C8AC42D|nr:SlyX family protein [Alterinioella nitratireducens]MAN14213.1 SlyX protein [Dinoroseobacter sp.]NPD19459.1 SlyX family protein [Alterinioella nitratireducens]
MSSLVDLEEALAHLTCQVEEMSDVIARQDREIDRLTARVQMLMNREAEREADSSGTIPLADQKPPHW